MILYVDGGCIGNDQRDLSRRHMVIVVTDGDGAVLVEREAAGGSNNIAELAAVSAALAWCVAQGTTDVEIRTDSRNNFSWVLGRKIGKRLNDREAVLRLRAEIEKFRQRVELRLVWVPRDQNRAGQYIERRYGA